MFDASVVPRGLPELGLGRIKGIGVAQSSDYHVDIIVGQIASARSTGPILFSLTGEELERKMRGAFVAIDPDLQRQVEGGDLGLTSQS
jgi:hypothetical protein